jgi:RHS repeat-associated protein
VKSVAAPAPAQSGDANYDYVYDDLRRLVQETLPEDNQGNRGSRHYLYDLRDNLVESIDARGYSTYYEYDQRDRLVKMIQPDPNGGAALETVYSYNPAGELTAVTDPLGRTSVNRYDNLSRLVQVTLPDPDGVGPETSPRTRYRYDAVGNVLREEDALGHATTYAFDNLNRQISVTDANGDTTYYAYDENGNTVALTDPVGNTTAWVYDALDRPISETNELGDARYFWYDQVGNLRKAVDRMGRVVEYDYDALYRRIKEEWRDYEGGPVVRTIQYSHYESGDLASLQDPDYGYNYLYDDLGRVLTVIHTPYTGVSFSPVTWNMYDAESNRTDFGLSLISGPDDFTNHYTFDGLGRVTSIEQSGNFAADKRVDFAYDRAGQWDTITRYADLAATQLVATSDYTFDAAARLRNLTYAQGSTVLADYHWDFDAGNRTTLFYSLRDGTATYAHDDRNQLTDAAYTYQNPEDYEYDENGNRINGGFTVGYNNRLTSDGTYTYQYDAEGNRTAKFIDNDGNWALSAGDTDVTQYTWDHRNRLVGVTFRDVQEDLTTKEIAYVYDPFNRLIARKFDPDGEFGSAAIEETYYVYDGNQIVAQLDGPSEDDITNRYLWGPAVDQLLADEHVKYDAAQFAAVTDKVVWPFIDHLNTIRDLAIVDTKGTPDPADDTTAVVTHRRFDAFGLRTDQQHFDLTGAPIAPTDPAAVDTIFNHAGRFVDPETNQENDWYRWRDLFTHTWLSEDPNPTQFGGGDPNLYRYVGNAPTSTTDPSGLDTPSAYGLMHAVAQEARTVQGVSLDDIPFVQPLQPTPAWQKSKLPSTMYIPRFLDWYPNAISLVIRALGGQEWLGEDWGVRLVSYSTAESCVARSTIRLNVRPIKQSLVDTTSALFATHPPQHAGGQAFTRSEMVALANSFADAYIRAVDRFLQEHPGASPGQGTRYPWENATNTPVCEDWQKGLLRLLLTDPAVKQGDLVLRAGEWGTERAGHNVVMVFPRAHVASFDVSKQTSGGNAAYPFIVLDPHWDILPRAFQYETWRSRTGYTIERMSLPGIGLND